MVLELAAGAAAAGPALIVAAPLIPIVGVAGLVAGAEIASAAAARARLTEESRAAIQRAMAQRLSPERLGACLRDTLVARSGGRLTGAEITTPGSGPRTTLGASAAFNVVEPGAVNAADPFLKLALTARLAVTNAPAAAGAEQREAVAGQWTWVGERQNRYLRWAADDGVPLEPEIGLGIGLLARRILGDLYPELRTPVPRSEREREQYRAACRPPERVAQPVSGGG
jgi:hypothetical protein